jgi:hypothetical protein
LVRGRDEGPHRNGCKSQEKFLGLEEKGGSGQTTTKTRKKRLDFELFTFPKLQWENGRRRKWAGFSPLLLGANLDNRGTPWSGLPYVVHSSQYQSVGTGAGGKDFPSLPMSSFFSLGETHNGMEVLGSFFSPPSCRDNFCLDCFRK